MALSESIQDYLKSIYKLQAADGHVTIGALGTACVVETRDGALREAPTSGEGLHGADYTIANR